MGLWLEKCLTATLTCMREDPHIPTSLHQKSDRWENGDSEKGSGLPNASVLALVLQSPSALPCGLTHLWQHFTVYKTLRHLFP